MQIPPAFYKEQLETSTGRLHKVSRTLGMLSKLRIGVALAAVIAAFFAFRDSVSLLWMLTAVLAAVFIVLVRINTRKEYQEKLLKIRIAIIMQEQQALAGNYSSFASGAEYTDSTHPYSFDLDIFGKGSIYQMLCRAVTYNGASFLANWLKELQPDSNLISERQEIIKELSSMPLFLEDIRVAGLSVKEEEADYKGIVSWMNGEDAFINNTFAKVAIFIMPLVVTGFIVFSFINGTIHPLLAAAAAINWMILSFFKKNIQTANWQIGKTSRLVEKYQMMQAQVAVQTFKTPWLARLRMQSEESVGQITKFRKLAATFDARNNNMVGPLMNSLFLFDIYCLLRLEWWRRSHKNLLLETMEEMIDLDIYVSCAVYAFNHPENNYPDIDPHGSEMAGTDLRHPLLSAHAVGNDFSLGRQEQFYLLTGANMTGKSTFIRTVGVSVILGYMGMPVPAKALSLPLLKLYTSIRVTDSVQDDVSYFRAELNRIKEIMNSVQASKDHYLVLLDEPLRGTNSADKQQGTRAIIESLLRHKAIGIVATHDIGLCVLETDHPGQVSNYHFESKVKDGGLTFDFRLHPGGSTSNNATILMRQMGIIK